MIAVFIENIETSFVALQSAFSLSKSLKKEFGIICFTDSYNEIKNLESVVENSGFSGAKIIAQNNKLSELSEICEQLEVSFLFIQLSENRSKSIQKYLNACRDLRIPYLIYKDSFPTLNLEKVLVPVTFLEEEYEKAQFASAFGRFCSSEIHLLPANDYGSKAKTTTEKMTRLFDKFSLNYIIEKAEKDSFKVEKEAVSKAEKEQFGIVLLSASRDYGLDDIFFGPKEKTLIQKSSVPLLLVNPRGDLYALCD
jgi:hypothetical protein